MICLTSVSEFLPDPVEYCGAASDLMLNSRPSQKHHGAVMFGRLMPKEGKFFDLFNAHAELIVEGGQQLVAMMNSLANGADGVDGFAGGQAQPRLMLVFDRQSVQFGQIDIGRIADDNVVASALQRREQIRL